MLWAGEGCKAGWFTPALTQRKLCCADGNLSCGREGWRQGARREQLVCFESIRVESTALCSSLLRALCQVGAYGVRRVNRVESHASIHRTKEGGQQ